MVRRILTVAAVTLLALPLGAAGASASPGECKPGNYENCTRPVWCDGTGYSCDATGLALYLAEQAGDHVALG